MPNPIWAQNVPVLSNRVLELQRGNAAQYTYTLPNGTFPTGTTSALAVFDTSGNVIGAWAGTVSGATISFVQPSSVTDKIPAGSSWTLTVTYPSAANATMLVQGTVVRNEAPFPGQSPTNILEAVDYSYTFATPGILSDAAWNILTGQPVVYNNSSVNLPNAVAAGAPSVEFLDTGSVSVLTDSSPWSQASMLYYAPLPSDPVSMSYNVVNGQGVLGGETWIVVCSAYDMSSGVAFFHQQFSSTGTPTVGIATMTGPNTFDVQASVNYTTLSNDNFVAQYNPATNTYALFLFGDTTPLVTWTDSASAVPHGPGYRYVGFSFESGLQAPGVEICNWNINPGVVYAAGEYTSVPFELSGTAVVESWATTINLVGVGGGAGGNAILASNAGIGGLGGTWNARTLTVGATGADGIKAGSTITVTVGTGGAGGESTNEGTAGAATTFSWVDASGTSQSLSCAGGAVGTLATNLTSWGLSPGNLNYAGQEYVGGAIQTGLGTGYAPGGGGVGGSPVSYGFAGGSGQAWITQSQS